MPAKSPVHVSDHAISGWDLGRDYGFRGGTLPDPQAIASRWQLTLRQAALFSFGYAEAVGYRYPPGFRERAEWLFRNPDPTMDGIVVAIFEHAIGTTETGSVIFPHDFEQPPGRTH